MEKQLTKKQIQQFNFMRSVLIRIAKGYQSTSQLRRNSEKQYGLDYDEALEMTYENIQNDAANAVKGVKEIKIDSTKQV